MTALNQPQVSATLLASLVGQLSEFIDPENIIVDAESKKPYECDGLSMYTQMPLLVVLPETIEQAQKVMRLCHREWQMHKQPTGIFQVI